MAFAEDLSVFFDVDGFAVAAEIRTAQNALVRTVNAILSTPSQELALFAANVEAGYPFALFKTADLADVTRQHKIVIAGTTYRVERLEHDGTGVTTVQLR
jgi:hypothetical protein